MNTLLLQEEEEEGVIRGVNNVVIPTILIFEILLLLPVRLLLRFRCVCKEWCDLIDSRVFKDTFLALRRRAMPVDDQLFIFKGAESSSDCWYSDYQSILDLASKSKSLSLECWFGDYQSIVALASAAVIPPSSSSSSSCGNSNDFEIPSEWSEMPLVNIINHVDGIICLFDDGDNNHPEVCLKQVEYFHWLAITLVNPALREFRKLPPEFDLLGDIFNRRVQGIGIGFSNNNEYKVVALVTVFEKERNDYGSPYKHIGIVYHLTTNSWTMLGDLSEFVSCKCFCHPESVFSHGSVHWCVKSTSVDDDDDVEFAGTNKHQILAFDVTSESFRKIPFPHGNNNRYPQTDPGPHLFTVDKSTIALVESIHLNVFDPAIEIWVMNEYGNNDSWSKRWLITNLPNFASTLCFMDQDKILIDLRPEGLISYDLSKGQLGDEIPTRSAVFSYRPLVSCHESFVSVKQL